MTENIEFIFRGEVLELSTFHGKVKLISETEPRTEVILDVKMPTGDDVVLTDRVFPGMDHEW